MDWRKFLIFLASFCAILVVGIWLYGFASKGIIENQLNKLKSEIEARNDGSSLIYDDLIKDKNQVMLSRIIYQDGRTGARLAMLDIEIDLQSNDIDRIASERLEWINPEGNLLSLDDFSISDIRENPSSTHNWNAYLFSRLQGTNLTLSGLAPSKDAVDVLAEQIALSGLTQSELGEFWLKDVDVNYTPSIGIHLDDIQVEHLNYAAIDDIVTSFNAGYIPVEPLSELAGTDFTMSGLELELADGQKLNGQGGIDPQDLLQLFLNNAPDELTSLLGTDDAGELSNKIEELNERDPNDVAVDALQMMIELLKKNAN